MVIRSNWRGGLGGVVAENDIALESRSSKAKAAAFETRPPPTEDKFHISVFENDLERKISIL